MPLRSYGLVKGRPLAHHRETDDDIPHYQIHLEAGATGFRLPVDVKSSLEPSQLVYFATAAFLHPLTEQLPALAPGFYALPRRRGGGGIDYIRSKPFDLEKVIALPHDLPGMDNDLGDLLASQLERARRFEDVVRGGGTMPPPDEHEFNDGIVRIVGALVNPFGHDPSMESVTLNLSPEPIDLAGWQIANRNDDRFTSPASSSAPARRCGQLPADVAPLGNQGSEISLLDRQAARVHGVAYTGAQASRQGWTLSF